MNTQAEQALIIAKELVAACLCDPEIFKGGDYAANVRQITHCYNFLSGEISNQRSVPANPEYRDMGEVVCKALALFTQYPDLFNGMFANVFLGQTSLKTIAGLTNFVNFLNAIKDDHSFRLDDSSGLPVVHYSEDAGLKAVTPANFYYQLSKLA